MVNYEARDVYAKRDHVFENTGKADVKAARNCLVTVADHNGHVYYLTMTTHNHNVMEAYQKYPDKNYMLTKKNVEELKTTSLVNLDVIYKDDLNGRLVVVIPTGEFEKLIRKFKDWQNKHPHKLYKEIKDLL